ncbi:MAG: pseudouridine synthase [Planctomycetota bacterium]|nr:pseudouridine synthase [Planctomycetota bacterium]
MRSPRKPRQSAMPQGEFADKSRGLRLQRVMADAGVAARRECEELVLSGAVTVNGKVIERLPAWVDPSVDKIEVYGRPLRRAEKHVYIVLFKPRGTVCTNSDPEGRPRAIDLVEHPSKPRLYCVGRLDLDSSGLLILTNDGEFANRVTHPRYLVEKGYDITVDGRLDEKAIADLERKIFAAERGARRGETRSSLRLVSRDRDKTVLHLTLCEHRNLQIRPLMLELGHPVNKLRRCASRGSRWASGANSRLARSSSSCAPRSPRIRAQGAPRASRSARWSNSPLRAKSAPSGSPPRAQARRSPMPELPMPEPPAPEPPAPEPLKPEPPAPEHPSRSDASRRSPRVDPTARTARVEPSARPSPVEPTARTARVDPSARPSPAEPTARTARVEPSAPPSPVEPSARTARVDRTAKTVALASKPEAVGHPDLGSRRRAHAVRAEARDSKNLLEDHHFSVPRCRIPAKLIVVGVVFGVRGVVPKPRRSLRRFSLGRMPNASEGYARTERSTAKQLFSTKWIGRNSVAERHRAV